jgi:hypothetical protein
MWNERWKSFLLPLLFRIYNVSRPSHTERIFLPFISIFTWISWQSYYHCCRTLDEFLESILFILTLVSQDLNSISIQIGLVIPLHKWLLRMLQFFTPQFSPKTLLLWEFAKLSVIPGPVQFCPFLTVLPYVCLSACFQNKYPRTPPFPTENLWKFNEKE